MGNTSILLLIFVVCVNLIIVENIKYLNHEREDVMPLITPFENSLKLEVHENLALECDAYEAIEWWYSNEGFKESEDFIKIDDHQRPYGIRLHLENVSVVNVGAYFCIKSSQAPDPEADWSEQQLMELVNNDNASTIYIFVNDPNNLLAPVELKLTAVQNSEIVIPCKPSMPETEVVLKFKGKLFYSYETSSQYNPTQGFVIEISNVYDDSGKYYCRPKTPSSNNADEVTVTDVRYINNRQIDKSDYHNNKPIIKSNSSGYVYEGETFELTCEMSIHNSNVYQIDWIYPDKTDKRRVNITYSRIDELARITLVVKDSQFTDSGSYKCVHKANQLPKEYSSYNLSVMEPHTGFLQLANPSDQYTLNEHAKKTILMTANFKGYPQPSFKWYKPNGIAVGETEQNLNIISTESSITLRMVNAQLKDSGTYILEGTNVYDTKKLVFNVNVISPPVLSMDDVYVMEGREAHLKCTVQSYPTAAVTFLFQPCSLKPRWPTCQTPFQNLSYKTNTTAGKLSVELVHEVIFTPTEPGYILCVAQNLINNIQATTETAAHVILSDIPKNLTIVGLEGHLSLPIGYEETFTCAALAYHFRAAMQWLYNGEPIVESNDITMNTTSSKYSYKKILKFNSITDKDQGTYTCRAWYINQPRRYESRDIYVNIYKPMAPQWFNHNLSHLKTNLVHHVGNVLDLECKTNAMPQAKVRWFKSEVELHKTNTTQISDDQTMLRIPHLYSKVKGVYKCEVENRFGTIERSFAVDITLPGISETWICMCIILIFFLVALSVFLVIRYRKEHKRHLALKAAGLANFEKGAVEHINPALSWNEQAELLPYDRKFEFPRDKLMLGMQLGSGAFGVVFEGEAQGIQIDEPKSMVAVKMVNSTADIEEVRALVSDLKIMVHLRKHLNVVNLLGAVTKNIANRELMVIVEYCRFGNVQSFLLRNRKHFIDQINPINDRIDAGITTSDNFNLHRDGCGIKYAGVGLPNHLYMNRMNFPNSDNIKADNTKAMAVTTIDLVSWAFQVARGMDYLSSKGVLHGDLAARNILLCENNVVKICDFGLARTMYSVNYKKSVGGKLPIKWMALESLNDLVFSTYSDVWSFGIVLWELFSLSTAPYPGIDPSHELFNKLKDGYRMEKPPYANQELYDIMLECWRQSPDRRPLFNVLERRFANMLTKDVLNHLNDPYMHANLEKMKNIPTDYLLMTAPSYASGPIFPYMKIPEAPVGYLQMKRIAPQSCQPQVPEVAPSTE